MRRVVPEKLPPLDPAPHDTASRGAVVLALAEVGRVARWWRTRQRRSLHDAAGMLGVTQRLLAELERGERGVRLDKALDLLAGMGFDVVLVPRDPSVSLQPANEDDKHT
jgi:HTH-type transcriptional regulator / antitoxin HipB